MAYYSNVVLLFGGLSNREALHSLLTTACMNGARVGEGEEGHGHCTNFCASMAVLSTFDVLKPIPIGMCIMCMHIHVTKNS